MMFTTRYDLGYDPRPSPSDALIVAAKVFFLTLVLIILALLVFAPIHPHGPNIAFTRIWYDFGSLAVQRQLTLRFTVGIAVAFVGGLVAYLKAWKFTPPSEPFDQIQRSDPHLLYGEYAREDFHRRLYNEAGWNTPAGLYIAPHLALPRTAETKNILAIGAPNSGKSNIIRALVDQAIARGDRVLLLCNKGDVTSSFDRHEATLIAAHHLDSDALDLAADHNDVAAATQLAADVVEESQPPFWSNAARTVLTDIILTLIRTKPGEWTAGTLLRAVLSETNVIQQAIARIDLSASPLFDSSDSESDDKTVVGILLTMRTAAYAKLRPLAWAWDKLPKDRRFSVKAWLSDDYKGPKTVIVQYSPEYGALSSMVAGNLICRISRRLADPQLPVDPKRRVVLALDEFHILAKIDNLEDALAVGREKGLVLLVGIQSPGQLIKTYGENVAEVLLGLFGIKIYGSMQPGADAKMIAERLGNRDVSALVRNRAPGKNNKGTYVEERKSIPTYSVTQLAAENGIRDNERGTKSVRAVVHCFGQAYVLDWPLTIWRRKRKGFAPAPWLHRPPTVNRQ